MASAACPTARALGGRARALHPGEREINKERDREREKREGEESEREMRARERIKKKGVHKGIGV